MGTILDGIPCSCGCGGMRRKLAFSHHYLLLMLDFWTYDAVSIIPQGDEITRTCYKGGGGSKNIKKLKGKKSIPCPSLGNQFRLRS